MEIVSGQTAFRLERDENLNVNFVYFSPGTGTRLATINIEPLKDSIWLQFFLVWSPNEIRLHIGGDYKKTLLSSNGWRKADYQILVGSDGNIYEFGGKGIEIMNPLLIQNGKTVVENTAIESWEDTAKAIEILLSGSSAEGYAYENVVSCAALGMLCTGFEVYCKKRFLELVGEGIEPDYNTLEKAFFSRIEREKQLMNTYAQEAEAKGLSLAHIIVEKRRIDFGNYQNCKDAYGKAYGIRFAEDMSLPIQTIQKIIDFIDYRHRIVHVSVLQGMLNYYEVPQKQPVFASKKTLTEAVQIFGDFVQALHQATLRLNKNK